MQQRAARICGRLRLVCRLFGVFMGAVLIGTVSLGSIVGCKSAAEPGAGQPRASQKQTQTVVASQEKAPEAEELSEQDQTLIQLTCKASIIRGLTLGEVQQGPALTNMKALGVQVHTWKPEIMAAFKAATAEVMAEEVANDAKFAKVYESYTNFRADYAEWARLSRIPAGS